VSTLADHAPRRLTVVVPVHNEAENVGPLVVRVLAAMAPGEGRWSTEILFVDDGSTDGTVARIEELRAGGRPVGYLQFSRNFGHQAAIVAGLSHAEGDVVVTMDGDLQHPPEELPRMLLAFEQGADVVQMVRADPTAGPKGFFSVWFYRVFNRISEATLVPNASDFRLLSRQLVEVVLRIPERQKLLRGLVPGLGFRQVQLEFDEPPRLHGTPTYSFGSSLRLAQRTLFDYSAAPLKGVYYAGIFLAMAAFLSGIGHVARKLLYWDDIVPGFTDLITAIFFLGGCTLVALGIVGRYQLIILEQLRGRPAWIVQRQVRPEPGNSTTRVEPSPGA
jgi:glycosyltransferase involved in cell wall biosynthesis